MRLALGIDTGGTYTDAVLVDHSTGDVLAGAKALTTRHDLSAGIGNAIDAVFRAAAAHEISATPADVVLVALSTTLATNTLAEQHTAAVCLLLIGYDSELMQRWGFSRELATGDVVYLPGGHNEQGNEAAALDEAAARAAILARREIVEAFAVSGYFSVRNPSHELRVAALVRELTGKPVTCGHELTSRLNAVRRATTAALNAGLILPLTDLMAHVRATLTGRGIEAPLMIVRGDGSLVSAEFAMGRPIETVLSGPAASAVGAWHLAQHDRARLDCRAVWTVDVGGTTTDIAVLRDGWPVLNAQGARVAGWRTMVEAVDVHTTGLGGDSHVRIGDDRRLLIGPRRAVPLCLLASEHPEIIARLREQVAAPRTRHDAEAADFIVAARRPGSQLAPEDQALLAQIAAHPQSIAELAGPVQRGMRRRIADLERRGVVRRAGFTPTDALHVLGQYRQWDAQAAQLGAELLAADEGATIEAFCREVVAAFSRHVAEEIVAKILEDEIGRMGWSAEPTAARLLQLALDESATASDLDCALTLRRPLVAIGAPVSAYLPRVAEKLHTTLIIPTYAEVANAVGAVSGSIVQRMHLLINPLDDQGAVRVHLENGVHDFARLDAAVAYAQQVASAQVEALARAAGAEQVEVRMVREDHIAPVAIGTNQEIYLGTELHFTAAGRPSPARRV